MLEGFKNCLSFFAELTIVLQKVIKYTLQKVIKYKFPIFSKTEGKVNTLI